MLTSTFGVTVYNESQFVLKNLELHSFSCCLVYVFIHIYKKLYFILLSLTILLFKE